MRILLIACAAALTWNCASNKSWLYKSNNYEGDKKVKVAKIAIVTTFKDNRENENTDAWLMYMIPLMPFGWQTLGTPEGNSMHAHSALWTNFKPSEDFAKALASELEDASVFKAVSYETGKRVESDYLVEGNLKKMHYKSKLLSYCLSVYGPVLWLVGLPSSTISNEIELEISVTNRKTNKVVFQKSYQSEPYSKVSWIYSMDNDFAYPDLLKKIYAQFVTDLKASQI